MGKKVLVEKETMKQILYWTGALNSQWEQGMSDWGGNLDQLKEKLAPYVEKVKKN